jgi:spermidine synthase
MTPWETLDAAKTPDGDTIDLRRRGQEYLIRVAGQDLMGSRNHGSEEVLAERACAGLRAKKSVVVVVGGLGMGFTQKAALSQLGSDACVVVAELIPAVVAWNRTWLADLAGRPLDDPRSRVHEGDVATLIDDGRATYDAIMLDTDNGPEALTSKGNARLYGHGGLERAARALKPGGVLAVWSAKEDRTFESRLRKAGFEVETARVRARRDAGSQHTIWLARRG